MKKTQLIFIYNADSGVSAGIKDSIQKIKTGRSECSLCSATWVAFNKKTSWSEKEKRLKVPFVYYHRDDMPEDISNFIQERNISLPAVLINEKGGLRVLVPSNRLDRCVGNDDCVWLQLKAASPNVT
jgi:hypothetical protein